MTEDSPERPSILRQLLLAVDDVEPPIYNRNESKKECQKCRHCLRKRKSRSSRSPSPIKQSLDSDYDLPVTAEMIAHYNQTRALQARQEPVELPN